MNLECIHNIALTQNKEVSSQMELNTFVEFIFGGKSWNFMCKVILFIELANERMLQYWEKFNSLGINWIDSICLRSFESGYKVRGRPRKNANVAEEKWNQLEKTSYTFFYRHIHSCISKEKLLLLCKTNYLRTLPVQDILFKKMNSISIKNDTIAVPHFKFESTSNQSKTTR